MVRSEVSYRVPASLVATQSILPDMFFWAPSMVNLVSMAESYVIQEGVPKYKQIEL